MDKGEKGGEWEYPSPMQDCFEMSMVYKTLYRSVALLNIAMCAGSECVAA